MGCYQMRQSEDEVALTVERYYWQWISLHEKLRTIDLDAIRMKGYGFQIEMKYTAWKLGLRLKEVSIIFVERREGVSKMSGGIFREAFFGVLGLPFRTIRKAAGRQ